MENLAIDDNTRNTLGAVTNDGSQTIKRLRVNPVTGALICEMNVVSSNTSIGSTIPGGTQGSVLFLGLGSTLSQDNTQFFWDDTKHFLGLGTNTPSATLDVDGTAVITGNAGTPDELLGRQMSSGQISGVTVGTGLTLSGGVLTATGGGSGITSINADTTAAQTLSTATNGYINITDLGSGAHTFGIDIGGLTSDSTFITDTANSLLGDNTFLTDLANNSTFYTALANNTSFISDLTSNTTFIGDIVTIVNTDPSISIDLASQVTGVLPVINGGTGSSGLAPYSIVFGGTGATAPVQSTPQGTTGQVLTSNGSGVLPTFQNVTAGGLISAQTGGAGVTILANLLGTGNLVEFEAFLAHSGGTTFNSNITISYGGQNILDEPGYGASAEFTAGVFIKGYFFANGSTSSQHATCFIYAVSTSGTPQFTTLPITVTANLTVDSTTNQTFEITIVNPGSGILSVDSLIVRSVTP